MPHILKNKRLEIQIDLPHENYCSSRFDWTGKITSVKFDGIQLAGVEQLNSEDQNEFGKGFYNEFGIDTALGYDEAVIGGWFHKIGVGLLKKEEEQYFFSKNYKIKPAQFDVRPEMNRITITCISESINEYSYKLHKEIELLDYGFNINYQLKNTGERAISTSEYVHNFITINKEFIGGNYVLRFPFPLNPGSFEETVNPENRVEIVTHEFQFNTTPEEQFFFSRLSGGEEVKAHWELSNLKSKLVISETGNFQTRKVNLWGWKHVISPELFYEILVEPGHTLSWSRKYNLHLFKT